MVNKEYILEQYNNPDIKSIYGFMYGQAFVNCGGINGKYYKLDKVIEIPKEHLNLTKDKDAFYYIWGWPGPDCNIYEFEDYGKTWVFADKELRNEV